MPPLSRRRQKPLGPAPLASFDRGLSSECNSFDEGLSNLGKESTSTAAPGRRTGHIGVLCQTSIMEEATSKVRTRTIACQTDRSAIRDGIRGKQRKSSQSQTSFDQEPAELLNKRPNPQQPSTSSSPPPPPASAAPVVASPPPRDVAGKQDSLQPFEHEIDRLPSPSRPSTLDLAKKQKKAPTTFSKVQKLELKEQKTAKPAPAPVVEKEEKKRTLLGKKDSVVSASGTSEKSRSSGFRSPFSKRRGDEPTTTTSSRAVSPMLQIRQRIASLSPGRGKKKNVAKTKLEALMNRVATVEHAGTECMDTGDGGGAGGGYSGESVLNRQRPEGMSIRSLRPNANNASQSLSPKPSRKGQSHALSKLQALIDRSRLLHVADHPSNHDTSAGAAGLTHHHTAADVHHSPAENRRRSKSSPPEPEPYLQHRLSIGAVWTHHAHHHHHHHGHHGILSKTPSNPPSPFEEVTKKKFSVQEDDNNNDSEDEKEAAAEEYTRQTSPTRKHSETSETTSQQQPFENEDEPTDSRPADEKVADLEEQKKNDETLLTTEDAEDEPTSSVSDILDKALQKKAHAEMAELKKKVQAEREKRQTFKTAPVQRPRSATREINVVELHAYVAEAEKQPAPSTEQRIKLNLHLNQQDQSVDEVDNNRTPTVKHADPDDWKRFCEQGLLNKRRSRLERAEASESGGGGGADEWADFNKWSKADKAQKSLPIPMIIETAWTPMEHRILNVTPSPSTVWDTSQESDSPHGDVSSQPVFDESFTSITSPTTTDTSQSPETSTTIPVESTEAHVIVILPPSEPATPAVVVVAAMNSEKPATPPAAATTATTTEAPKSAALPLRKAPAAPTRKAPPPPGPPGAKKNAPEPVIPAQPEPVPEPPAIDESWNTGTDPTAYSDYDQAAYNAYYYPEYSAEQQQYYTSEYYEQGNWQQEGQYYPAPTDTGYYEPSAGEAVAAVLGSQTDFTGQDGVMSDPSAIDIGQEKSTAGEHGLSTTHDHQASAAASLHAAAALHDTAHHVEHSPLLQGEDEDDDEEEEDTATVILNPHAELMENVQHSVRNSTSSLDSPFQPLTEAAVGDDDGSGIDRAVQSKHRRLSKVPYTSLDVEDNQEEEDETAEPGNSVPEEETVTPLLAGNQDPIEELPEPEPAAPVDPVGEYDPSLYDPAIYDPAGTGYDINSQEYYDYYYGHLQQPVGEANHYEETPAAHEQYPSVTQPTYEYTTTAAYPPPAEDYSNTYSEAPSAEYYEHESTWAAPKAPSPEWPTYNAYVPPVAAVSAAAAAAYDEPTAADDEQYTYEESEVYYGEYEEETEEAAYGPSTLSKERLFDEEGEVPFGNLRPEPKRKDTSVSLHLKMAKGLKPSKKKIVNLITKGKYSSGKKKDLFDEIEQNFTGPGGGGGGDENKPNPPEQSEQWRQYQNLMSGVQSNVDVAKLKNTPLQTPSSPADERKAGPPRPPVHTPVRPVEELFNLSESIEEPVAEKKAGPPGRPPPPKAKPGRPPPPKKTDSPAATAAPETVPPAPPVPAAPDVSDELADFFGAPMPAQKPDRPAVSAPRQKAEPPAPVKSTPRPPAVVPPSAKAVSTDIKPVARPKAGAPKGGAIELPMAAPVPSAKTPSQAPVTVAAPVAAKKTSNVDDLFGLFDTAETAPEPTAPPVMVQEQNDPFSTGGDPFSTDFHQGPSIEKVAAPPERVNGTSVFVTDESSEFPPPPDTTVWPEAPQSTNFEPEWSVREPAPPTSAAGTMNGIRPAAVASGTWEPWGASDPTEIAAAEIVNEAIAAATDHSAASTPSTASTPRAAPGRPPLPPRPAPPPNLSRKDMFLQSTSEDSDVTFAATFSHTQDESPTEDQAGMPIKKPASEVPAQEHETKVVSQVESMVVRSQPSPSAVRKSAQIINSTPWGDEPAAGGGFDADFENDPFGDSQPAPVTGSSADPFGGAEGGFSELNKPTEEETMLKLVASYKNHAPAKINTNASLMDDSFFDPFATIIPEDSPAPTAEVPAVPADTDDDFDIWEAPVAPRPDSLVTKDKVARRTSTNSNVSRRTSGGGSVQTPLYDEDDSQPIPEFTWDHPQTTWELLLRSPPKKTFSGTRYWKQIHVKLTDTTLQLYNKAGEQKPFHELPLQGNYMVTEIAIQPLDVFTKIHTTKIEYVFYKERVGIRPGQITKASKGQITKLGLPLEHASQTTELLKFGSLNCRILRDFVHAVEDVLFRIPMMRDRAMIYKQEEVQAHVIDEFTARVDKAGIISDRRGRVRVYCLSFVSGMPEVEFGLNDITRKGREVVGRHDILPIYTEEWIRMENVELHHCVSKEEYAKNKVIKFVPPDACFFELARFRVRPPKNRELPLAIRVTFNMEGYRVGVKVEAQTTAYYNRKRAQPCDDIQIRVPIPESWIYLFRTEKLFGYGSKHATSKKAGLIKGMSEKLRTAGVSSTDPSQIAVTSGSARYEHVYRSLVWRISRLPKEGQGAFANHMMTCRLDLNSYDTMPERFEPNADIEFTMPAATASHTTLRSISATCDDPPEKWVKYLAKYEYVVEIDYKIDRGDVQLYGAGATD